MRICFYEPDPLEAEAVSKADSKVILEVEPMFREGTKNTLCNAMVVESINKAGDRLAVYRLRCNEEGSLSLQKVGAPRIPKADMEGTQ